MTKFRAAFLCLKPGARQRGRINLKASYKIYKNGRCCSSTKCQRFWVLPCKRTSVVGTGCLRQATGIVNSMRTSIGPMATQYFIALNSFMVKPQSKQPRSVDFACFLPHVLLTQENCSCCSPSFCITIKHHPILVMCRVQVYTGVSLAI